MLQEMAQGSHKTDLSWVVVCYQVTKYEFIRFYIPFNPCGQVIVAACQFILKQTFPVLHLTINVECT